MTESIKIWWNRPIRGRDRVLGFVIGLIGGFIAGALGRLLLGPSPMELQALVAWAVGSMVVFSILGVIFPKVVTILLCPFATISVGGS